MLSPLQTNVIQREVDANPVEVVLLDCVDSTNTWVLQQLKSGKQKPFVCFAEQQTGGRGRRGKSWVSPPFSSIYMSLAWSFELPMNELATLSLIMGLAVVKTLEKIGMTNVFLKWPNDVLVGEKKIAGILLETISSHGGSVAVIGVGLNYQMPAEFMGEVDCAWTDVSRVMKNTDTRGNNAVDRSQLAGQLLRGCIHMCEQYPEQRTALLQEFADHYDACKQQAVNVRLDSGAVLQGIVLGITGTGELRVQLENEIRVFNSAEISLRKTE